MVFIKSTDSPREYVSPDQIKLWETSEWVRVKRILISRYNTCISVSYLQLDEEVNEEIISTRSIYARHQGMIFSCRLFLSKDALQLC